MRAFDKRAALALQAICIFLLWPTVTWAQGLRPRLTRDQAIDIAASYCQRIGAPVKGEPVSRYPADATVEWRPTWSIQYQGVFVELLDSTGSVCQFSDSRVGYQFDLVHQPEGQAIGEDEAIQRAKIALLATG